MKVFQKMILLIGLFTVINPYLSAEADSQEKNINNVKYQSVIDAASQLFSNEEIEDALYSMADEMNEKLADQNPTFLCVLNGAIVPMGQLLPLLDFPLKLDYIDATRYNGKMEGGDLRIVAKPRASVKDKVIVVMDDILDSGKTMQAIVDYLYSEGAKKVYTAVMIDKKDNREEGGLFQADFVGLQIPNQFIIGYGLDYEQYFRNLDGIYVMPQNEIF